VYISPILSSLGNSLNKNQKQKLSLCLHEKSQNYLPHHEKKSILQKKNDNCRRFHLLERNQTLQTQEEKKPLPCTNK